jgi:hypothetical protein
MGDEGPADDAEDIHDKLRAAYASIPWLLATWSDGWFDATRLAEWLAQLGEIEIDSSTDGKEAPTPP